MNKIESALRRTTDTRALAFGVGTLPRAAELFVELFPGRRALVVADLNTWRVAGEEVHRILGEAGIGQDAPCVFADPGLYAEWGYVERLDALLAGTDAVGAEAMDDFAFSLVQDGLPEALCDPTGVHAGDVGKVGRLAEGLLLSGFAMQAAQSSRPASGAEHQFSHLWDMEHLRFGGASVSHGFKVGIGTLASTAFLEMLLEAPVERLDVAGCVAAWKSWEETERDIRAVFAGDPELVARGLKETYGKYVDRQGLYEQLTRLRQAWPELRERIRRQIIPFGEVHRRLRLVGAPCEPEQIGVSRARFREAFARIPYMRSRYSVIDTVFRCGWMEEWLDRLFGPGCIWEIR